jgi:uncharacterized membrane protein YadS
MAWSAFGWMGIAYVVIVPIPFLFFSYLVRRRKKMGKGNSPGPMSIWTSPIPYFAVIFLAIILFNVIA